MLSKDKTNSRVQMHRWYDVADTNVCSRCKFNGQDFCIHHSAHTSVHYKRVPHNTVYKSLRL